MSATLSTALDGGRGRRVRVADRRQQAQNAARDEHEDKKGEPLADLVEWSEHVLANIPQQENVYDCGVFMLQYARVHHDADFAFA